MIGWGGFCATPQPHQLPPPLFSVPRHFLMPQRKSAHSHNPSLTLMKTGIQKINYSANIVPRQITGNFNRLNSNNLFNKTANPITEYTPGGPNSTSVTASWTTATAPLHASRPTWYYGKLGTANRPVQKAIWYERWLRWVSVVMLRESRGRGKLRPVGSAVWRKEA